MKTNHRSFSGIISSLLFAAGLSNAASRFDPLSQFAVKNPEARTDAAEAVALSCVLPSMLPE